MEYQPDAVVVMDNINDLTVNYRAAVSGTQVDSHYAVAFRDKRLTGDLDESDVVISRLFSAARTRLAAARRPRRPAVPESYDIELGRRYFRRNLENTHALVSSRGAKLVLLTMPVCESEEIYRTVEFQGRRQFSAPLPGDFARFNREFDIYNDTIRAVAATRGTPLIDMARLFGRDARFFSDFVHYNAAGSKRFGELAAREFTRVAGVAADPAAAGGLSSRR
jgi:hypothetical protein